MAHAYQSRFYPRWNHDLFHSVLISSALSEHARRNLSRGERAGLCLAMALAPEAELRDPG